MMAPAEIDFHASVFVAETVRTLEGGIYLGADGQWHDWDAEHPIQRNRSERKPMTRYITLLGVILAVLALIFQLAGILASSVLLILAAAVIVIGIGSITGM
jgi:hypothetical protein